MVKALVHLVGYLFASAGFGLKTGFTATFLYVVSVSGMFLILGAPIEWPMVYGTSLYVFGIGTFVCAALFLLSVPVRNLLSRMGKGKAGYIVAATSALITMGFSVAFLGRFASALNLAIYVAAVPAIYFGARFYTGTWKMIEEADPAAFDTPSK